LYSFVPGIDRFPRLFCFFKKTTSYEDYDIRLTKEKKKRSEKGEWRIEKVRECSTNIERERERERERDRETERQKDRQTGRQKERKTERQKERKREREREIW
jgi:hypothetical protein